MLEIGGRNHFISSLQFEEYMYVGTNTHSTSEPVTKVSELNFKQYTASLWWASVFTIEPSFTSHTLQEGRYT